MKNHRGLANAEAVFRPEAASVEQEPCLDDMLASKQPRWIFPFRPDVPP